MTSSSILPVGLRPWCVTMLACVLFSVAFGAPVQNPSKKKDMGVRDAEFSLGEFYDIKASLSSNTNRKSPRALRAARIQAEKHAAERPKIPNFYGQDHYERSFVVDGKERWIHVGRPDEVAYDMFFKSPGTYNGTFIEVGAGDGVKASNTLFFEESLGWSGLLVEGATENFLRMFGTGRRKRSVLSYSAVCRKPGTTKFVGDGLAAGAMEDMTRQHVESWGHHFKSLQVYDVPCDRLGSLVRRAKMPRVIDFMSVDLEGGELRALDTFDWSSHSVRVLTIEPGRSCFQGGPGRNLCSEFLKQQGFCLVARKAVNEFWVSDPIFKQMYCH